MKIFEKYGVTNNSDNAVKSILSDILFFVDYTNKYSINCI